MRLPSFVSSTVAVTKQKTTAATSVVLKNVHTLTHGTEAAVVLVVVQNADTEGQWRLDKNGVSDR